MVRQSAVVKARIQAQVDRYRLSEGAEGGYVEGRPVLLLTTTGRRTGRLATVPLVFFPEGDQFNVVAANAGRERAPDWLLNLQTTPMVQVKVFTDEFTATARVATAEERASRWEELIAAAPFIGEYQRKMRREIALVVLIRLEARRVG